MSNQIYIYQKFNSLEEITDSLLLIRQKILSGKKSGCFPDWEIEDVE